MVRPSRTLRYGLLALSGGLVLAAGMAPAAEASPVHKSKRHARQAAHAGQPAPASPQPQKPAKGGETAGPLPFVAPITSRFAGGTFSVDTKGITLKSDDEAVKFRIGGRLQMDGSVADLQPSRLGSPLSDDFHVRRAWVESYLTINNAVEAAFQYDFNDATKPINDAILAYRGYEPFIFTIGNFKEPFSLNQLISDNNTLFTERSLLDTFAPARDFGAAVGSHGQQWTAVAGVYGGNANTGIADNGVAGTARVTYAPILDKDQVLHFGLAGSYRSLDQNGPSLSFGGKPEDYLFAKSLTTTGTLRNAADVARVGVETLYQVGPWRVQAEYALTEVGGRNGQGDRTFQAGYVEAGWVVNGKGRTYRIAPQYGSEYAVLQGVEVEDAQRISKGGIGVFELGARFSAIDLDDGITRGGFERNVTAGVNWYPDKNVRVMADYVRADATPSASSLTGRDVSSNIFVGRVQFYW